MDIKLVPAWGYKEAIKALFSEYTALLIAGDPGFQKYLELQNYDRELEHLEVKYGPPAGRLYLALCGGVPAGCAGLRRLDGSSCEIKRLYVRPQFRGRQIGDRLVKQVVEDAKGIGYSHVMLDTFPFLETAIRLYQKHGFYEIPSYNDSPMDTLVYLKLDLSV